MADTKISAMPAATTPLAGTEVVAGVQGGSNVKILTSSLGFNIKTFTSGLVTLGTGAGRTQFAHGLGVVPKFIQLLVVCTTNDNQSSFIVGQSLDVFSFLVTTPAIEAPGTLYADSTNIYFSTFSLYAGNETAVALTNASGSSSGISVSSFANFRYQAFAMTF